MYELDENEVIEAVEEAKLACEDAKPLPAHYVATLLRALGEWDFDEA